VTDLVQTQRTGHVLVVTLNRPEARNALNPELIDGLSAVLRSADADPEVRVIVLAGAGPVFSAGLGPEGVHARRPVRRAGVGFTAKGWQPRSSRRSTARRSRAVPS